MLFMMAAAVAFSSGGGSGELDDGVLILQSCDALNLCKRPDGEGGFMCPDGMTKVAPPVRTQVYSFTAEDGSTSYTPGSLVPLTLRTTRKQILGKRERGNVTTQLESSKYIGLLIYAVRAGDSRERKVGSWEVPGEVPPRFWVPPDPGCMSRSLMHASAMPKAYVERFLFRAPNPGYGALTFRVLIKQGDTNAGAFYWAGVGGTPSPGVSGGDLTLVEAPVPPAASTTTWLRAVAGETCSQACARASLACDEAKLSEPQTAAALQAAVEHQQMCQLPLLESCAGPGISTLVDGFCWYPPSACNASGGPLCDAAPPDSASSRSVRLCSCREIGGRRLSLEDDGAEAPVDTAPTETIMFAPSERLGAASARRSASAASAGDTAQELAAAGGCPNARFNSGSARPCPTGARALHGGGGGAARPDERSTLHTTKGSRASLTRAAGGIVALVALVALGAAVATRARRVARGGRHAAIGAILLSEAASAHNWLNSPRSRTPKLSMTNPCPKRQRHNYPDIQVNRGQPFTGQHPPPPPAPASTTALVPCPCRL